MEENPVKDEDNQNFMYKEEVDGSVPLSMFINPNLPQEAVDQFTGKVEDKESEE